MRVIITTEGYVNSHTIDAHNELVKKMNRVYGLEEHGANGGKGFYCSHAYTNYSHITEPIHDKFYINDIVTVFVDTIEDEESVYSYDEDDASVDEGEETVCEPCKREQ